jgi:hypothetical protein
MVRLGTGRQQREWIELAIKQKEKIVENYETGNFSSTDPY